jgi:AcrR family transcriptional regulator
MRILETADRLFYTRGIGRVGVDTIVAESGVAKATLYAHFRTKDDLVAACLASRSRRQREALEPFLGGDASPRDRVLAAFARRGELLASPEWRGCAFINARAEYPDPGGVVRDTVDEHREWIRQFFYELATQAAHPDPAEAASRLIMIWDAAAVSAIFEDPEAIVDGAAVLARGVLNERKQRPTASAQR